MELKQPKSLFTERNAEDVTSKVFVLSLMAILKKSFKLFG